MDAFVQRHLQAVSRTYALVIPMLPEPLDEAVGLGYLLLRVVDTLEDTPLIPDVQRRAALAALDVALARQATTAPNIVTTTPAERPGERDLMRDATRVLQRIGQLDLVQRRAILDGTRRMIAGVQMMLARSERRGVSYPGVRNAGELRTYCYFVAGVVGQMLCTMIARHLRQPDLLQLRSVAVELGIGLQLVNILKDGLWDARRGRRYLPATVDGRVSHTQIQRAVLAEARRCLQQGIRFVLALPAAARGVRAFCGLPIAWGALTLRRAEAHEHQPKIGRAAIYDSMRWFDECVGDDRVLPQRLHALLQPNTAALGA